MKYSVSAPAIPSNAPPMLRHVPSCTFEASLAWRKILRLLPVKERCLDGNGFRLYYWTHPFYRGAISTPFRDRLALEWEGSAPPSGLDLEALAIRTGCANFIAKDVYTLIAKLPDGHGGLVSNYINSEVCLDGNIEKRIKHSARKNLHKAQEDYHLAIDIDPDGVFEDFYQVYLVSRRRLGVLPYPRGFFRALFELRGESVVLFSCRSPEGVIGYLLCYLHGPEMISAHLAYDSGQRHKRISDFLFMNAFQWGRANGFLTYRFGADNRNQTSLLAFKQKLGAVARRQLDFHLYSKPMSEDRPDSLVRRILRVTPMPLFRLTGSLTGLYFV